MSVWPFLHFFCFIAFTQLAIFVWIKNPKSSLNRACAALIGSFSLWSFGKIFIHNPTLSKNTARLFENINSPGWISSASLFLLFAIIFSKRESHSISNILYPLLFIFPAFFIYKHLTNSLISDFIKQPYGWTGVWSDSIWPFLFYLYYLSFFIFGLYLIYRSGKDTSLPHKKIQSKIIFATGIATLLLGTFVDVILTELEIYSVPDIANVFVLIWAAGVTYTIFKYRFLTITPAAAAENIISTLKDPLILLDSQGSIVEVNPSTLNLLEYKKEELEGEPIDILCEKKNFKESLMKTVSQDGYVGNREMYFRTKSGKRRPVNLSCSALRDERDTLAGIVCIAKDMTEFKWAERARRESEEKFLYIAENSPNMIFIAKRNRLVYTNRKFEEIMGYTRGETYSSDFKYSALVVPEQVEIAKEHYRMILSGGDVNPVEYTLITKKGKRIEALITTKQIIYEGERAVLGIVTDISELRNKERLLEESTEALRKSEERFRLISEMTSDYIFLIRVDEEQNLRMSETYGKGIQEDGFALLPRDDMAEVSTPEMWMKVIHPDDREKIEKFFQAILTGESAEAECRILERGDVRWYHVCGRPEYDQKKLRVIGIVGAAKDITERKQG